MKWLTSLAVYAAALLAPMAARADLLVDPVFASAVGCLSGGGTPVGVLDGTSPTGAWSASRKLLTAYGGAFYTSTPGGSPGGVPYPIKDRMNPVFDQSGAARNLAPAIQFGASVGCTNPTSFQFYDPWQTFEGYPTMSDLISTTSGYIVVSVKINTGNANAGGNCYGKEPILQDVGGLNSGITLWNWTGGTTGYVCFHLWDGGAKEIYMGPIFNNTPYVFEWRKEGGVLYGRVNGGAEQSLGVGTSFSFGAMGMGARPFCCITDTYIYEAATWITPPSPEVRNTIANALGTYIGADMCGNGSAARFLARTTGLDAAHTTAYTRLLNGLDADGLTCLFDFLYIYATQDSTTALLNLVQNAYNGTVHGSPTFTADRGFTGTSGSSTIYIDTGFNATTASSPKYTQNSAHLSSWSLTNSAFSNYNLGTYDGSTSASLLNPKQASDTQSYFHIQAGPSGFADGVTTSAAGHFIGSRDDATNIRAYYNGTFFGLSARTSTALNNLNAYVLGYNNNGTAAGNGQQQAMASSGSLLTASAAGKLYNRLCNYMADVGVPNIVPGTTVPGTEAATFLARTSGLDATHVTAYTNLINGLVTDGIWSKLDVLHIYATQDSKTSLLNLISCAYTGVNSGATFTADRGWQGTEDGSNYIDTQFNPSTATSPKYTQNSAHVSIWGTVSNGFSFDGTVGGVSSLPSRTEIYPWLRSDGNIHFHVNGASFLTGITNIGTTAGFWLANRTSSTTVDGYRNGSSIYSAASTSVAVPNISFNTIAVNDAGTHRGNGTQGAAATIGQGLTPTEIGNLNTRLRTYMTAVGVP